MSDIDSKYWDLVKQATVSSEARLVLADVLEERGLHDKAAQIRNSSAVKILTRVAPPSAVKPWRKVSRGCWELADTRYRLVADTDGDNTWWCIMHEVDGSWIRVAVDVGLGLHTEEWSTRKDALKALTAGHVMRLDDDVFREWQASGG